MPLDLSRIHAICFDIDGTLRDTDDQMAQQLASLLKPFGLFLSHHKRQVIARRVIMALEQPGNFVKGRLDAWRLDGFLARLGDRWRRTGDQPHAKPPLIIPGVRAMLAQLSLGYPLAVVSARGERSTRLFLDSHDLAAFFQVVVTEQTCPRTKPYPDPIFWAARHMNVAAENCLMVGDTTVDIRAGRAAGCQTVGVLCGFGQEDELRRAGADLILPTTADVADYLG